MKQTLSSLTDNFRSLSIIGMCKNAGKTTALNRLIAELSSRNILIGLTSIGRDGESRDVVTATPKPSIYVREGTIIGTAERLLCECDAGREILDATGINTPLGQVVIFRCKSDGYVQVAGPSINSQLALISQEFQQLGVERVIIDGAISRKTLCSKAVTDATVLCTGASYNKNIDVVVEDTAYTCKILCLDNFEDKKILEATHGSKDKLVFSNSAGELVPMSNDGSTDIAGHIKRNEDIRYMFINGAVTDALIKPLVMSNVKLDSFTLICEDGSKILAGKNIYERFAARGGTLRVANAINLTAVTINPFSAYGYHFDKDIFMEKMLTALPVPVINVEDV